ncbi:AGE family epimerase/isomerase [Flammeovirgaceae bacterium SG7u.111]|nr:AGE family epimerase/isomerase [Flammeovirgaceae bacterium SG7u.132]WPO38331.1 AGE family epimerase/isomerase [Flammeovirgaceae bacterium SG7u.111]
MILQQLKEEASSELFERILPYWMDRMTDHENGGFYGQITGANQLVKNAPKGAVLNTRILWTFSEAYFLSPNPDYLESAQRAYGYLKTHFFDKELGGVYWSVDFEGKPLDTKKQVYAQSFGIYALTAYYKATRSSESLELAKNLFHLIEKHSFDTEENGYFEAYTKDWQLMEDLRLSEKDANEKKTMNTHLHVLEAYTTLVQVWGDPLLKKQLKNLIELFLEKFIDPQTFHFNLFFDEYWHLKSKGVSYGHDIEGSWLLQEAAEALGDESLIKQVETVVVKMAEATLAKGIDEDGGLYYELHASGKLDTDKHWWPQAEAVVGFVNAWQLTKEEKWLAQAQQTWEYLSKFIVDRKDGEWHFKVSKEGKPYREEDKAGLWKCPYHNGRACMELMMRAEKYV